MGGFEVGTAVAVDVAFGMGVTVAVGAGVGERVGKGVAKGVGRLVALRVGGGAKVGVAGGGAAVGATATEPDGPTTASVLADESVTVAQRDFCFSRPSVETFGWASSAASSIRAPAGLPWRFTISLALLSWTVQSLRGSWGARR